MNWDEKALQKVEWNGTISHLEEKQAIAEKIAKFANHRVIFGKKEIINAFRLQIELWVNIGRRIMNV